jgi:beta-glucosidase
MTDPTVGDRMRQALERTREREGSGSFSPGGDRARITLGEADENLIEAVAATNPRTVVVIMGGSAVVMERWRQRVPAILLLWYPGMEGGHALADVLLGKVSPGGRLPFAIPTAAEHLAHFDRDADKETYDLWHGQWKLDRDGHAAAYPFGFGLSYTTFTLGDASIANAPTRPVGSEFVVQVTVTNSGSRHGAEVVQVYGGMNSSKYERPARRLLGFTKVEIAPGKSQRVEVPISLRTIAVRKSGQWIIEPGEYEITIARHAGDPAAQALSISL